MSKSHRDATEVVSYYSTNRRGDIVRGVVKFSPFFHFSLVLKNC